MKGEIKHTAIVTNLSSTDFQTALNEMLEKLQQNGGIEIEVQYQVSPIAGTPHVVYSALLLGRAKE